MSQKCLSSRACERIWKKVYYYPSARFASAPFQWVRDSLNVTKDTKHNKDKYGHVRQRNSEAGLDVQCLNSARMDSFIRQVQLLCAVRHAEVRGRSLPWEPWIYSGTSHVGIKDSAAGFKARRDPSFSRTRTLPLDTGTRIKPLHATFLERNQERFNRWYENDQHLWVHFTLRGYGGFVCLWWE